ncbi:response regulator [bacterium]|nr:response regulator [bacterium]
MNKKEEILIVDDHEMMRKFLSTFLSRKYKVAMVGDGVEALEWLANNELPKLIIADLDMPRMNGYDFLNHLASTPAAKVPVLILSSASKSENRIKAYTLGAVDVLNKPFNPMELDMKIERISASMLN